VTEPFVSIEGISQHVATVRLKRPPNNFFSFDMISSLADALEELDKQDDCRCIVLAAEGKNFCAGADFSGNASPYSTTDLYNAAARLFRSNKPFVAAVIGAAIGGGLGLMLLALRVGVRESGMYNQARDHADEGSVARGNFFALFSNRDRFLRYLRCILIGLPTWFMIGILVQRASTVFAPANGITGEPIKDNWSVAAFYLGLTFGDLASGVGSQLLRSRKKVVLGFLLFSLICVGFYLFGSNGWSSDAYYRLIFLMGFGMGYWALFVTIAAEQFGTNLRATVATTVPNFARGSLVPLTFLFTYLAMPLAQARVSPPIAGAILGVICFGAAFLALWKMEETYGKDLDYQEKK
jgi:hypothetical protein